MRAIEKLLVSKRLLLRLVQDFTPIAMFQSFSLHDLVLADLIMSDLVHDEYKTIHMFTINPGQLPLAIVQCIEQLNQRYGNFLKVYSATDIHADNDHHHRYIIKSNKESTRTESPLRPALVHKKALISTIDPSGSLSFPNAWMVWDYIHQMPRFNPLARWTHDELTDYARHYNLPHPPYLFREDSTDGHRIDKSIRWWQSDFAVESSAHHCDVA